MRTTPYFIAFLLAIACAPAFADTGESPAMMQVRQDADRGNVDAQNAMADAYFHGLGEQKNPLEAIRWWRKAADQGSGTAYSLLGTVYYQGIGVPKDSAEAVRMWQKGAEKYDLDAQSQLGFAYLLGDTVPRNFTQAYMWFNIAASNGDKNAPKNRDSIAQSMTADMVSEAQQLGNEWMQQHPRGPTAQAAATKP